MGRKTELANDDEQRSLSNISRISTDESRDLNENKMNDIDDNDPLIHDSILPHRKRIRKDALQYLQPQQSSTSCRIVDVSNSFLFDFY
jgi:hypothetical protein